MVNHYMFMENPLRLPGQGVKGSRHGCIPRFFPDRDSAMDCRNMKEKKWHFFRGSFTMPFAFHLHHPPVSRTLPFPDAWGIVWPTLITITPQFFLRCSGTTGCRCRCSSSPLRSRLLHGCPAVLRVQKRIGQDMMCSGLQVPLVY